MGKDSDISDTRLHLPNGRFKRKARSACVFCSLVHRSPSMISGVLIFNQKGENLIFRAFRNDCRPRLADVFRIQVISNAQVRSPILTLGSTTFSHVKHENIYLVAITKSNANAALVFEFLYRLIQLGKGYFGKFDEEAVKNNFVLVYELLDGMWDTFRAIVPGQEVSLIH